MYIISRNEDEFLQVDESWVQHGLHCPKVFESHEAADEWVDEQSIESVRRDFISIVYLPRALREREKRGRKAIRQFRKDKKSQRWNQYIKLDNPIDFFKAADADNVDAWVFDRFTATHLVVNEGHVSGVLGATSTDSMPFYCYTGEEYDDAFRNYTRQPTSTEFHDYRSDGF